MIDFHSHILPGIDDGAKNPEMSVRMLTEMAKQGVDIVFATPHCYMQRTHPDIILADREKAYRNLKDYISFNPPCDEAGNELKLPKIICGAEVYYHSGISQYEKLNTLCAEGTNILLLEMPEQTWGESIIRELEELSRCHGIRLMLAHIERFVSFQKPKTMERLRESGVIMQSNAEFFIERSKKHALRMLQNYEIHVLGTDAHNLTDRAPNLLQAYQNIEKKLGPMFIERLEDMSGFLLGEAR